MYTLNFQHTKVPRIILIKKRGRWISLHGKNNKRIFSLFLFFYSLQLLICYKPLQIFKLALVLYELNIWITLKQINILVNMYAIFKML